MGQRQRYRRSGYRGYARETVVKIANKGAVQGYIPTSVHVLQEKVNRSIASYSTGQTYRITT